MTEQFDVSNDDTDQLTADQVEALMSGTDTSPTAFSTRSVEEAHLTIAVGPGDVAALYVDGLLVDAGDHVAMFLTACERAGIALLEGDGFLLGAEPNLETVQDAAAKSLIVAREFEETHRRTAIMRSQAEALNAKADEMEEGLKAFIDALGDPVEAPESA